MAERLVINNNAQKDVQAYLDYLNVVGDQDHGQNELLSEEEYEKLQKEMAEKYKNRIYCAWKNVNGLECKMIGPATKCFCDHRFKDHEFVNPKDKKVHCKVPKCNCQCFYYIPTYGSYDFKCLCKHSYKLHDPVTKKCKQGKCGCNPRFASSWTCSCGAKFGEHETIFETRQERAKEGKQLNDMMRLNDELNAPMSQGGLMSFQQLVDGADKFENIIEKGNQNQKQIGYQQKLAIQDDQKQATKNSKLKSLNQKLLEEKKKDEYYHGKDAKLNNQYQEEEEDKQLEEQEQPYYKQTAQQKQILKQANQALTKQKQELVQSQQDGFVSALDLYNQPHMYMKVKVNFKKKF